MKKYNTLAILRTIIAVVTLLSGGLFTTVSAYDMNFFQGNNILYYNPDGTAACVDNYSSSSGQGSTTTGNGATGNVDYKGRQVIPDDHLTKIKNNQPVYEKASKETKIPWQVFAVVHIRESVLADFNPANGQGIYQDFERLGNDGKDYPPGDVTDEEFLRQTINAGKILQEKAGSKLDLVEKGDTEAIKDMFFGYNGRAAVYIKQAADLGFENGYEGSPYVMNIADAKRDPEVNKTTWGQIKTDLGGISYPANGDYGAYIMYAALAGVATTGGDCTNGGSIDPRVGAGGWSASGPNSMVLYYQIKEPWASASYGPHDIAGWGCGPTSTAMAIATLNKDSSVNPENMAKFFYDNGYLVESGTSWAAWESGNEVAKKYGVTMTELGTDMSKAAEAVKRGSFVVLSVSGEPFTCATCGHILLIRAVTNTGNFLVADPASESKTLNEAGYDIQSAGDFGIRNMWELRKG